MPERNSNHTSDSKNVSGESVSNENDGLSALLDGNAEIITVDGAEVAVESNDEQSLVYIKTEYGTVVEAIDSPDVAVEDVLDHARRVSGGIEYISRVPSIATDGGSP